MKSSLFFLMILFCFNVNSQDIDSKYSVQTSSLDNILSNLYQVISGEAGVKRDWDLFKYIFHPDAKLIPVRTNADATQLATYLTPAQYIERSSAILEKNGFFEKEISRVVEEYGSICHVFSTYESFRSASDIKPFARGINSIQLFNDGQRWWILNIYWQAESEKNPLPLKYLAKG